MRSCRLRLGNVFWELLVLVWVRFPCWFMLEHRFASDWSPPVHHMFDSWWLVENLTVAKSICNHIKSNKQHFFFLHIKVILVLISLNGSMWQLWVTMAVIRFDFSTSGHHTESYSASGSVGSSCCWRIKHSLIAAFPSWFGNLSFRSLYSLHVLMETFSTVILNQTAAVCFMFAADKKIFCHFYVQPDCWSHWTVDFSVHTESLSRLTVGLKL